MRIRTARAAAVLAGAALCYPAPAAVAAVPSAASHHAHMVPIAVTLPKAADTVSCQTGGVTTFSPGLPPVLVVRPTNVRYGGVSQSCPGTGPSGSVITSAFPAAGQPSSTSKPMPAETSRDVNASPIAVAVVTWPEVGGSSSKARHSADSASILAVSP